MFFKHYFIVFLCIMYIYQLAAKLTRKKHKWVYCDDHIDCVFSHLARQLYDTFSPSVLGSFQCAKLMSLVLAKARGAVDIVSVGPITIVKEKNIMKGRRKKVRNFGQFCLRTSLHKQSIFKP